MKIARSILVIACVISAHLSVAQTFGLKVSGGHMVIAPGTHVVAEFTGMRVEEGALLEMRWESFLSVAGLRIDSGSQFTAAGVISADAILNYGLMVGDSGESLTVQGAILNRGDLRIDQGTALSASSFDNSASGVVDMIYSAPGSTFPSGNSGTIYTEAALPPVSAPVRVGENLAVRIQALAGHSYILEKNPDLSDPDGWITLDEPVVAENHQIIEFVDMTTSVSTTARMFYRVLILD